MNCNVNFRARAARARSIAFASLLILFALPVLFLQAACAYTFIEQAALNDSVLLLLNASRSTGDLVAIDVVAQNVSNVTSAAFDLDFNSSIIQWAGSFAHDPRGYEPGSFFGPSAVCMIGPEIDANRTRNRNKLVVGATGIAGAPVSGNGTIVTVKFRVVGNGSSNISFSNNNLILPGMNFSNSTSWYGGVFVYGGESLQPADHDTPPIVLPDTIDALFRLVNITLTCTASDDHGLTNLTLYTNNTGFWEPHSGVTPGDRMWTEEFPVNDLPEGDYIWGCMANDTSGQASFSVNMTFTVNTTIVSNPPLRSNGLPSGNVTPERYSGELEPDSSMVVFYHLNNDSSEGENDTHVYDWSGHNNNATVNGALFNSSGGKFYGGFDFDGNDYMEVPYRGDASLDLPNGTIEMWVKVDSSYYGNLTPLVTKMTEDCSTVSYSFYISELGSPMLCLNQYPDNCFYNDSFPSIRYDEWVHLVAEWNATDTRIYVNGTLVSANISADVQNNTENLLIGAHRNSCVPGTFASQIKGSLDEIAIYNRVLTPEEIQSHYNRERMELTMTNVTLSLETATNATCRYAHDPGFYYSMMTSNFSENVSTNHSMNLTLSNNATYAYYVRCNDTDGNVNNDDYVISFVIGNVSEDGQPPNITSDTQENVPFGSYAMLSVKTDEDATCRYSHLASALAFNSMSVLTDRLFRNHSAVISGLKEGVLYNYYVKCSDSRENVNPSASAISVFMCYEVDSDCSRNVNSDEIGAFARRWEMDRDDVGALRLAQGLSLWKSGSA